MRTGSSKRIVLAGVVLLAFAALLALTFSQEIGRETPARKQLADPSSAVEPSNLAPPPDGEQRAAAANVKVPTKPSSPQAIATDPASDRTGELLFQAWGSLETFVTESPDILGWSDYWASLGMEAVLDPDSLVRNGEQFVRGEFTIPDSDLRIVFEAQEGGYTLAWEDAMPSRGDGGGEFRATFSFLDGEEPLEEMHGSVMFTPRKADPPSSSPIGYVYTSSRVDANCRPIHASWNEGRYSVSIPVAENGSPVPPASLVAAYQWLPKLRAASGRE